MKHLLLTTIAAVLLVGCGESQQSASAPKANKALLYATRVGNIEDVKKHLAAGVDVNTKGNWLEGTPLGNAAEKGHKEIAELLIAKGADVNAKNDGRTPLHWAAEKGHKETAELLIAEGAEVNNAVNPDFRTTGLRGNCVPKMVRKGANKWEENEGYSQTNSRPRWRWRRSRG